MTPFQVDPKSARQSILETIPDSTSLHGRPPEVRFSYVPASHAKALDLDTQVVVGMRGTGKSFWRRFRAPSIDLCSLSVPANWASWKMPPSPRGLARNRSPIGIRNATCSVNFSIRNSNRDSSGARSFYKLWPGAIRKWSAADGVGRIE
ncbi:MAG: hypothetical protein IT350_00960 [Deltaproteobacteria bacterium]|nr:hypothetical protein [Deltaproteobacteria bacterium]